MAPARAQLERRSRRTTAYWLWMLAIGMASAILALIVTNLFLPADRALTRDTLGQDFVAFYSAGRFVDAGRSAELYDLRALAAVQHSIAQDAGFRLASDVAPWWNPPLVAWMFAPIAYLEFYPALACWTAFNVACLAVAATLLASVIRATSERKRDWLLVPALLLIAPPTIQSLGHGQNTCLSLLLLTLTVMAWRARRPLLTGLACAALCYKPQLAAVVGLACVATLGWRVVIGALVGLVPALLLTINVMPGALAEFIDRVPANLHAIRFEQVYLWHRHATLEGFFRFLFQGNAAGETFGWIRWLSLGCIGLTLAALVASGRKLRADVRSEPDTEEFALDRFIALVILATPLSMPFFFDYDLLLLAIPCVLIAREIMLTRDRSATSRAFTFVAAFTFVWLACNPPMAEAFGINLTVPLLATLVALQTRRCFKRIDLQAIATATPAPIVIQDTLPERRAA